MLMRRRPLLRAAVVGGTAYYAGKKVAQYCLECDVRFACHGGCPKDRFVSTPDGEPGLNYLCPGFQAFFHHIDVPLRRMCELLREDRAPSEIVAEYGAKGAGGPTLGGH